MEEDTASLSDEQEYETDDEYYYEDDEDEEDEPQLKYRRIEAGLTGLLEKDTASTLRVTDKFIALGTHWGAVHILDFGGNIIKSFRTHAATVNCISIDKSEEFIATASDDGKVFIYSLYTSEIHQFDFKRPMKSVALDPDYARKNNRQFVSGGMAEQFILSEKGWLRPRDMILHANEGPIYTIQWRGHFIAWANDTGVNIYDTQQQMRITYVDRPEGSPRADLYKCRMCWKNDTTLLIGWADMVKIAVIRPRPHPLPNQPAHVVEIVNAFNAGFVISGIAPFHDNIILLSYSVLDEECDDDKKRQLADKPELHVFNSDNEEISDDVLPIHGYKHYQANDYALEFVMEEDLFFIMGPKDVLVAKIPDEDDHIEWLMFHERYGEALEAARVASVTKFSLEELGQTYLNSLIADKNYKLAAEECRSILKSDKSKWEDRVFQFIELGELKAIAPFIPIKDPQLSSTVYEIALAWFLESDPVALRNTIRKWPKTLYSLSNVIVAVEDHLKIDPQNEILLECLADLYTYNNQPDKAIEYNLRLRRPNAFELIQEYNMFDAVKDKVVLLMEFDQHLLENENEKASKMPAVQLLVKNTEAIPPQKVVKQLKRHPHFLHIYLDALFDRDHHIGFEFHDRQVELYAEYDYPKLLEFLRASHYISLEKAYKVCESRDLVPEMVYILGRMGDNKRALMLIIERLGDVQRAINFAKEQKDDDLWEDLLTYSMDKPKFIRGLLENVGTDIEPLRLIQSIPDRLEIPGLKDALLKILQDYNLQKSLHEGCEKILVSDSVFLADKMYKAQKRGVKCTQEMVCMLCEEPVFEEVNVEDVPNSILFFCRHAYHETCLTEKPMEVGRDPGALTNKINHTAILKTSYSLGCPLCREQAAGGNAFVNRMKSQRRGRNLPQSPRAESIRSFGTVHS